MNTLQSNDHQAHAKRLRDRAKECRTLSEIVGDACAKASYLELANAYEKLADHEELLGPHARIEDVIAHARG